GARAAGPQDLARLAHLRDEFRSAGAGHVAGRLETLVDAIRADDRGAAPALLRAMTAARLFDRMLTLEVAAQSLSAADSDEEGDAEGENQERPSPPPPPPARSSRWPPPRPPPRSRSCCSAG